MAIINPYLTLNGNAEEVFNFYKSVFGGEFSVFQLFKDMPHTAGNVSADDANRVLHVSLPMGNGNFLMGSDALSSMGKPVFGDNFSLSMSVSSEAEADRLYNGLSAGGVITMPLQKTFWGAYFGMFNDKFGIQWMVNYDLNEQ